MPRMIAYVTQYHFHLTSFDCDFQFQIYELALLIDRPIK